MLIAGSAQAQTNVFNMGGTRNPTTGVWTGEASLEFVTVGDPGNAADTGRADGYGSVGIRYQMGKYDVTVGQYANSSTPWRKRTPRPLQQWHGHGLFRPSALPRAAVRATTATRSRAATAKACNCPIFDVTWGDAARFCNWLQNGQPTGTEGRARRKPGRTRSMAIRPTA